MKLQSQLLKEQRGTLAEELRSIMGAAETEKRDLTDEQEKRADEITAEIEALDKKIASAEKREQILAANESRTHRAKQAKNEETEKEEIRARFSIAKAIMGQEKRSKLDGVEAEMQQEGEKDLRAIGKSAEGLALPAMLFGREQRDLTVGTPTAAGVTVDTELSSAIEFLYPRTVIEGMGATIMTGMTSNYDLIRQNGGTTAAWEGEITENDETNSTFENIPMRPKRVGAYSRFSKQLLLQSSISVDSHVNEQLSIAIGQALEIAAINGTGANNQPTGILNASGVQTVEIDTNGGAPTREKLLEMVKLVTEANADYGTLAYLTSPGVRFKLQNTTVDAGSGRFVWEEMLNLLGYNAQISNLVPTDLTKGAGTDLHAIIFGNWAELYMAQWGGLDLVVNPYSNARTAQVEVVANSWWDINFRHTQSFAVIKDAAVV